MQYKEVIKKLELLKNPKNVEGMARFGIRPKTKVYGVSVPELRRIARVMGKNHKLAQKLWDSKIHEARILASMVAVSEELTEKQIKKWASDFDSWDICDQTCMNLFNKSKIAKNQIAKFAKSKEEFIKRTAFALIAALAVHDKKMNDKDFIKFFPLIKKASTDERNFVKKSVNWALRQIGKRNKSLNREAIKLALRLRSGQAKSERWIGSNALVELTSENVQNRLKIIK
jgi:3-methyladenine DNA glycosylase AlkD